ncbi:MAG: helix-turn-helix domain-containing protein [Planctomycetota bacterium]|nr:helix-turn-helix domain-containing protein [Planctomycetota bacterium]
MGAKATTKPERLLLNDREAAHVIHVSTRHLWANTHPRGPIPCVRIGNSVRYSPEALAAYIRQQSGGMTSQQSEVQHGE